MAEGKLFKNDAMPFIIAIVCYHHKVFFWSHTSIRLHRLPTRQCSQNHFVFHLLVLSVSSGIASYLFICVWSGPNSLCYFLQPVLFSSVLAAGVLPVPFSLLSLSPLNICLGGGIQVAVKWMSPDSLTLSYAFFMWWSLDNLIYCPPACVSQTFPMSWFSDIVV